MFLAINMHELKVSTAACWLFHFTEDLQSSRRLSKKVLLIAGKRDKLL